MRFQALDPDLTERKHNEAKECLLVSKQKDTNKIELKPIFTFC